MTSVKEPQLFKLFFCECEVQAVGGRYIGVQVRSLQYVHPAYFPSATEKFM